MKIGRYEVVRELGRGGMAVVYLAQDPNMKRQVAIKLLPKQFAQQEMFLMRFQREVEVIATLEHSSIVPIYDSGNNKGQPYIVMRYMSGGSLVDKFSNPPIPLLELSDIFHQICEALDSAHESGIIHRDIKPANILFSNQGKAYLSDFGIAKLTESSSTLTGAGIVGTPEFMSPEQAMAKDALDGRSDIYSLGVILFYALTNRMPYQATTPMGTALAHINDPIPSFASLNVIHSLPPDCEVVVRKALAKKRENRYRTATDLADALEQAIKQTITTPAFTRDTDTLTKDTLTGDTFTTDIFGTVSEIMPKLDQLSVTLEWNSTVDLSVMAFYRAKDGQIGGVFLSNYTGGFAGDVNQFPFIHLTRQPTLKNKPGLKQEVIRMINLHQMLEVYICVINLSNILTNENKTFSQYDSQIKLLDNLDKLTKIPLNFAEVGSTALVAKVENTTLDGVKLTTSRRVMDLKVFQAIIPGAGSLQNTLLEYKLSQNAAHILDLADFAQNSLNQSNLSGHHAKVVLCLDISIAMSPLYETGRIQHFVEKFLALGCRLDDNGKIDIFLFGEKVHQLGEVNIDNIKSQIEEILNKHSIETGRLGNLTQQMLHSSSGNRGLRAFTRNMLKKSPLQGKVYYSNVMSVLRRHYFPDGHGDVRTSAVSAGLPVFVVFITNGDVADENQTIQQLQWAAYEPIFWQFIAIGQSHKTVSSDGVTGWFVKTFASDFSFLEKLDTMKGRYVDNANFFSVDDLDEIEDQELYNLLMTEYPDWVKLARAKYLLQE